MAFPQGSPSLPSSPPSGLCKNVTPSVKLSLITLLKITTLSTPLSYFSLYHLLAYAFTFTSLLLLSPPHSTLHKHVEFFLICSLLCSQCSEHCVACRLTDTKPAVRWFYSRALWLGVSEMSFHWEYLCDSENEIKLRAEGLPPAWGFFQPRSLYLFGSWPSLFPARPPTGIPATVLQPSLLPCPRKCRPASLQGRRTWPYDYPFTFDLFFSQPAKTT